MKEAAAPTATPERILVKTDEQSYTRNKANFEPALPIVQRAYDAFLSLNIGRTDVHQVIDMALFGNLETFTRDYIYEASPEAKALPLEKEAVMSMVKLPAGFKDAQQAFASIKADQKRISDQHYINPYQSQFFTLAKGKVSLNWEAVEQELDAFRTYITDPEEIALHGELKELAERMQVLHEKGRGRVFAQKPGYGVIGLDFHGKVVFHPERVTGILISKYY